MPYASLAHRRIEVGVEQPGRFVLRAGEQVPVAVERDATELDFNYPWLAVVVVPPPSKREPALLIALFDVMPCGEMRGSPGGTDA